MRVLITEDDPDLRLAIEVSLRGAGLAVDAAGDLDDADLALAVNDYDCAVFDRTLPSGDALRYVHARRRDGWTVPVLFLTARDSVADRVAGLEHGGDDYLVKPFALAELVARIRILGRRGSTGRPAVLKVGDVELDAGRQEVRRAGVHLTLTRKELAVLQHLMEREGQVVTRSELIEHCWDEMADPASNVLDVVIAQLRRKLGDPPMIRTLRGVGYVIEEARP